jgi:acyl carrier protein
MSTEAIIFNMMQQVLNISAVQCADYKLDSFEVVELLLELEREFNLLFSFEDCESIGDVTTLIAVVERKLSKERNND